MKFNFVIFFASKNNYDLLENWISEHNGFELPKIINIDLNSRFDQLEFGKKICKDNRIEFYKAERTEFQENLKQAFEISSEFNVENILYLHQDCFAIDKDTFLNIEKIINKISISDYGCVGFNIYHDLEINKISTKNKLMTTSRCVLQKGNGYYMRHPKGSRVNYKKFSMKPFVVENIMWTALLLNKKSFEKIKIDRDFNFFLAADDMAYQFLKKNIFNIVVPSVRFKHDQSIKTRYNLPKDSPIGNKDKVIERYGRIDHSKVWHKKWGFEYSVKKTRNFFNYRLVKFLLSRAVTLYYSNIQTIARSTFNKKFYKGTLLIEFYNHDPQKGPLKYL